MHLASEVSSTTPSNQENSSSSQRNGGNSTSNGNSSSAPQPLTAETLAERTIDSLMAEHPGELVRTGSPHIVSCFLCVLGLLRLKFGECWVDLLLRFF